MDITIDTILDWFKQSVETKQPIGPALWIESALKLNILKESLDNEIAEAEGKMIEMETTLLEAGTTAAQAKKLRTRAVDYQKYLKVVAKEKRIIEFIRLAKYQSRLISEHHDY